MGAIRSTEETGAGCRAGKVSDYLGILISLPDKNRTTQNKTKQN